MQRIALPPYSLWELRAGDGTPVALLHGLSGSSQWWSRNVDALAERHLVAAIDQAGFGRSRRGAMSLSFHESAALLARWIETFGEPVHLVGHSMGGQLAVRIAAERPDLVRSLVLVSAAGMPFHLDPRPHVRSLPKPPYGGVSIARVLVPDFLRAGPTSVAIASARVLRDDVRALLRRLRIPVLLVWGENDPLVPLVYGEAMLREIEGARLEVIPRAAHVPMWDTPDEFNRIVLQFLDDVERLPRSEPAQPLFSWGISGWTRDIAHRQAGRARDLVLIHGLGMSSAYLERLAAALFARGWSPIAPDLPGFGESANARAGSAEDHARALEAWADALSIRNATWVGHSSGCNAVAHLARIRPDLVRRRVMVGPLWTRSRFPNARMFAHLALDALREPLSLYRFVLRAYWRTGIARWLMTWFRLARDIAADRAPSAGTLAIAGERDPIPDRRCMRLVHVPGAHACLFSHPEEVAEVISSSLA
jgi:pimeloyl-ACP methyl ester carboxylesterase